MASQKQVGKAIIRLRKLHNLSQEKFALDSGIDRRYISDVENGKRNFSFELLNRVANFFNLSLSSFFSIVEQSEASFNCIEELRSFLNDCGKDETVYFTAPDFVNAIIGITDDGRLVYSYSRMAESLMLEEGMSYNEAVEFIESNMIRSIPNFGEHAPIIVHSVLSKEIK